MLECVYALSCILPPLYLVSKVSGTDIPKIPSTNFLVLVCGGGGGGGGGRLLYNSVI